MIIRGIRPQVYSLLVCNSFTSPEEHPLTARPTAGTFSGSIPSAANIAVFSSARNGSSDLNQYILYQDTTSAIQVVWQDDASGWKGPSTFTAFKGADNGTSITCLTPSSWFNLPLEVSQDMTRCYFQAGGVLREVLNNGTDWNIVGNVPISP